MRNDITYILIPSIALGLAFVACGGDDVAPADASTDGSPDAAADATPPEVLDYRVTLQGPPVVSLEVNAADAEAILPSLTELEATIRGEDDVTAPEDLVVEFVDAEGMAFTPSDQTFRNGLHRITTSVEPGQVVRARVTDAAGNSATSDFQLRIPTLTEALARDWELRFFDTDQTIVSRWTTSMSEDGTWAESREDTGRDLGGTFTVDGSGIVMEVRSSMGGTAPEDSDSSTVEERTTAELYVDENFLAVAPYTRTEMSAGGMTGTWENHRSIERPISGALALAEERAITLTLGDDGTFTETVTVTDHTSGSPVMTETTRSGTWEVVANENYSEAVADFLAFTTDMRDGMAVDPPEEELVAHKEQRGFLLLAPRLAAD